MRQNETARRQRHWDLRAAGNFIGGGSGTGLLIAAALWTLLPAAAPGVPLWPVLVGMGFVMMGLSLVWLEIGKPWRAFNVFFHPQTSWMTREGFIAAPLLAAAAAAAWFQSRPLLLLAAVLAAGFLYCQARILKASKAIPAWSHPRTVPLIVATALAEGSGLLLLLGAAGSRTMVAVALVAAIARELARTHYKSGLVQAGAPEGTLAWFGHPATRVLQGTRLIAALLLLAAVFGAAGTLSPLLAALGGGLSAIGGFGLKIILVTRAAFTRGLRIPFTPSRGRGPTAAVLPAAMLRQGKR
ncbi:MAG: dimethyl sulfoxide reductase anchor subunit [Rubrivivax sp.]|nr:dimethyl sulfoxide reductase anchor subunit [Rubrivivax sp.]